MSESPEEKTKRKYIAALNEYKPTYQMSVVLDQESHTPLDKQVLTNNIANIKKAVAKVADTPIIFWLQTKYISKGNVLPIIIMLFTERPNQDEVINAIEALLPSCLAAKVISRKYSAKRLVDRIKTLKSGKLNDLSKGFTKSNLRRFAVVNKKKILPSQ